MIYWAEIPLKEFAGKICKHFDDMTVMDTRSEKKPYMSLRNILSTVTLGGKASDATPNLPDAIVKSIFQGIPYPQTLFASCIRRIRAESGDKDKNAVHITRAAIIKAYLNRISNNQKIQVTKTTPTKATSVADCLLFLTKFKKKQTTSIPFVNAI